NRRIDPMSPLKKWLPACAAIALTCIGSAAFAQREQVAIDELVQKANSGAQEEGFCARTGWPLQNRAAFVSFLKGAVSYSWSVYTFDTGACVLNRVSGVTQENGGKCVAYTYYTCAAGGRCGLGRSVDCLDAQGIFRERRPG